MTIEQAIAKRVEQILAESPGGVAVSVDILPESPEYPAVCVWLVDEQANYTLEGTTRLCSALVQVDAFAYEANGNDPYADATELAQRINGTDANQAGLSGWRGSVDADDASPPRQFEVLGCFRVDRRRQYDPDAVRIVTVQQDYRCWYRPD